MRKVQESEHVDCVFGGYTGKKRWEVNHPKHPPTTAAAPDANSAMAAAAEHNGLRWQAYTYYAYARVRQL